MIPLDAHLEDFEIGPTHLAWFCDWSRCALVNLRRDVVSWQAQGTCSNHHPRHATEPCDLAQKRLDITARSAGSFPEASCALVQVPPFNVHLFTFSTHRFVLHAPVLINAQDDLVLSPPVASEQKLELLFRSPPSLSMSTGQDRASPRARLGDLAGLVAGFALFRTQSSTLLLDVTTIKCPRDKKSFFDLGLGR